MSSVQWFLRDPGHRRAETRQRLVHADADVTWRLVEAIGGTEGWYSWPAAWRIRGRADRLAGGPGLRRGRRDPYRLVRGEALDFWRVEAIDPGTRLLLRAETRLPGTAWLELRLEPVDVSATLLTQRVVFQPRGYAGLLYWWAVRPLHGIAFGGILRALARAAERDDGIGPPSS